MGSSVAPIVLSANDPGASVWAFRELLSGGGGGGGGGLVNPIIDPALGLNTTGTGTTTIGSTTSGAVRAISPNLTLNTTGAGTTTIGSTTSGDVSIVSPNLTLNNRNTYQFGRFLYITGGSPGPTIPNFGDYIIAFNASSNLSGIGRSGFDIVLNKTGVYSFTVVVNVKNENSIAACPLTCYLQQRNVGNIESTRTWVTVEYGYHCPVFTFMYHHTVLGENRFRIFLQIPPSAEQGMKLDNGITASGDPPVYPVVASATVVLIG
jgi:hypothetical protein